jgi:hypothetical protein
MRSLHCWLRRQIAAGLVLVLAMPLAQGASAFPAQAAAAPQQSASALKNQSNDLGSQAANPTTIASGSEESYPDSPEPKHTSIADQSGQPGPAQSGSEEQQNDAPKPVGTAAAPYEKTTGVAASRPAGAVIAPAKQRRARSILIRVGVIVGAAVAVGTVVALSRASPSRPN